MQNPYQKQVGISEHGNPAQKSPRRAPKQPKSAQMDNSGPKWRIQDPKPVWLHLNCQPNANNITQSVKTLKMTDSGQILVSCCVPAGFRNEPKRRRIFKPRGRTIALVPIVRVLCSGCHSRRSFDDSDADLAKILSKSQYGLVFLFGSLILHLINGAPGSAGDAT